MTSAVTRLRTVAAGVLGVITALALVASTAGWWAIAVVFDEEQVAGIAVDTVRDPVVIDAVARSLVDDALALLGAAEVFDEADRDALADELADLLAQPVVGDVLHDVVVAAHRGAMYVLADGPVTPWVDVEGDSVVVNVLPLWATALELATDLDLPPFPVEGDPAEQIAVIEATLGVELESDAGQVVLFRSDTVEEASGWVDQARQILTTVTGLVVLASVVAFGGGALTLLAARARRRAAVLVLAGVVGGCLLTMIVVSRVVASSDAIVSDPALAAVIHGSIDHVAGSLERVLWLTVGVCVVLAVVVAAVRRRPPAVTAPTEAG